MPRAPLFTEAEGVWGIRAVRDSGRQDDWGVIGHVGIWAVEEEQLQAGMYISATEMCLWFSKQGFLPLLYFITPHCPQDSFFYHAGLCSLKGPQRTERM